MGRAPCCDKANVKKGPWSPEEDAKLKSYIEQQGTGGNWIALPQKIGLKRCGKSCRLRWLNYLRPNIKHGGFSEEEDRIICSLYGSIGSRWSIIAAQLPGRTDNDIKNYWNTRLKKKLLGKQRKDQQHYSSASGRKSKRILSSDQQIENMIPSVLPNNFNSLIANSQVMLPYNWPPIIPSTSSSHGNIPSGFGGDHEAMRSLLLKLDHHQPMYYDQDCLVNLNPPLITNQHQLESNQLVNMLNMDGDVINGVGGCLGQSINTSSHLTTFPRELEELMSSSDHKMNGLDFLAWGEDHQSTAMINNNNMSATAGSDTSCGAESMGGSWCEMSSLVSLPMPNSTCQGFPPQDHTHELTYTTAGNQLVDRLNN